MEYLNRALEAVKRKPLKVVIITFIYLMIVAIIKWKFHISLSPILFGLGGIIGIYAIEIAEGMAKIEPSPLKTPLFYFAFILVSFFVVTSSGSFLASGLVMSVYLSMIFEKFGMTGSKILFCLGLIVETIIFVNSHAL